MPDPKTLSERKWLTPTAGVLVFLVVALLGWNFLLVRTSEKANATQQAEIENMVKKTNEFYGEIQKVKDDTRALLDPLVELLELDRRLEAAGLPPLSAKEFSTRLAKADQHLLATGATTYIDTCKQKAEVEKHLLYQGLHGPVKPLPGWSKDWQTACITILPSPEQSPPKAAASNFSGGR